MTTKQYINTLKNIPLFGDFSKEYLERLIQGSNNIKKYKKNSIIYEQGDKCNTLDIIIEGIVSIEKIDENGNVLVIYEFRGGDILGSNLIFAQSNKYPMTILSKTDCTILSIQKDIILNLCQTNKSFLLEYIKLISDITVAIGTKLNSITLKTIRQHILEFLNCEYKKQGTYKIKLYMTKKEWAERLGVQRPSLSRELIRMKNEKLIDYDKNSITITNKSIIKY
ncbi:cAMP-binding domain of CRP or a regulatory subunit of cAMP-dependent protein kinases [Alkalithermobacter thermoalcaliphilus JW-YL-7 = DSM 7308]|uniref:Putative transcriptional regulator, Crp/Fnr family n=1 Tax=Alkalithermobacter thermoalcaliphilus JW-YL-7 = DSM 7308 TaxID=1121328 RepID=A0A150FPD7_CLOPD|nr:putative transcriptional regulator, Crp/Fnr family [[Clostridium] paradoxum JW-YL-7 = DSM 7308]SHK49229.1 cAMP-binding domain of CRP or a regulatory subunit of cAMP-dependent protein kinases [[Clostridium] paradoxum JW-YL-7 = DSM 7308]